MPRLFYPPLVQPGVLLSLKAAREPAVRKMRTAGVRSVDDKDIRLKRGHKTKRASQSEARFLHAGLACWPARRDSNPRPSESEPTIKSFKILVNTLFIK